MPRLTGPCMSVSASGKLADSLVFGSWKGVPYCRSFVIPVNRESGDQGDNRLIVGGIGRAAKAVKPGSDYHVQMQTLNLIPNGQTKQSALVKQVKELYMADATAFEAIYTAFEAHAAKADINSAAAGIGLADFDVAYKGTTHSFSKGMMLYLIARYGIDNDFTGDPYTTAIASWDAADFTTLVGDLALPA